MIRRAGYVILLLSSAFFINAAPHRPYVRLYDVREVTRVREPISEYDALFRRVALREGVDWRLLAAIARHESEFREDAISKAGARGLMQVRPIVARHFGVPTSMIDDVETNITLAARLIRMVDRKLNLPDETPLEDRLGLVLACYNAGDSHVLAARKRASNPNSWIAVSSALNRRQTTAFVRKVMRQYSLYRIKRY